MLKLTGKSRFPLLFIGLLTLQVFAGSAEAAPQCATQSSRVLRKDVTFCVERSQPDAQPSDREPIVYFMHGINGGARSWTENGYSEALNILARDPREAFQPMTFVSFDTEGLSVFSDRQGERSGPEAYETWLIEEFIPWFESTHTVCKKRECRGVAGLSMGGLGAIKTALRHSDLFSVVAANSPALWPFPLYRPVQDWMFYFSRHEVGQVRGMAILNQVRSVFSTDRQADESDPAWLAGSFWDSTKWPALYFDVGGNDYFGFNEGFDRFRKALDEKHWSYQSSYVPDGTHDLFWQKRWDLMRFLRDHLPR